MELRTEDAVDYFRMGLVTGLVTREEMVAWADHMLAHHSTDDDVIIIELSLMEGRPYEEIVWELSHLKNGTNYELPLNLLLAQASLLLEQRPDKVPDIIMGLYLLNEEAHFPKTTKVELSALKRQLDRHHEGVLAGERLRAQLADYLHPYAAYQTMLQMTLK